MNEELLQRLERVEDILREHTHNNIDGSVNFPTGCIVIFSLPGDWSQTAARFGVFFTAQRPCYVKSISEVHTVAGSDAGAVTLQVERLTGTAAPGAGTNLLMTAFDLKGTANTVQNTTKLIQQTGMRPGDRLALKSSGVLTALQGVQVTLELSYIFS